MLYLQTLFPSHVFDRLVPFSASLKAYTDSCTSREDNIKKERVGPTTTQGKVPPTKCLQAMALLPVHWPRLSQSTHQMQEQPS